MIGLGLGIPRTNIAALSDAGSLGDFLIQDNDGLFLTDLGERLITSVDVDTLITDTFLTLVTDTGAALITFES